MRRREGHDAHFADWLSRQAWSLVEAGRPDEAIALFRRAAEMGDVPAMTNLANLLTDRDGAEFREGVGWYHRYRRLDEAEGCWHLAMAYRLAGNRRRYLFWMRRSAAAGQADAVAILAEIARRRAAGRPWPMFVMQALDTGDALFVLREFRQGLTTGEQAAVWADRAMRGEVALQRQDDRRLALVLTEMADPARPLTRQRALELICKLGG